MSPALPLLSLLPAQAPARGAGSAFSTERCHIFLLTWGRRLNSGANRREEVSFPLYEKNYDLNPDMLKIINK